MKNINTYIEKARDDIAKGNIYPVLKELRMLFKNTPKFNAVGWMDRRR